MITTCVAIFIAKILFSIILPFNFWREGLFGLLCGFGVALLSLYQIVNMEDVHAIMLDKIALL